MTPEMVAKVVRSTGGKRPISLSVTKTHTKESKVLQLVNYVQCSYFCIISMSITTYHLNHKLFPTPGIPASSNLASGGQFRCKGFGKNLA